MTRQALSQLHPQHRLFVPAATVCSVLLLVTGLSLPLLYSQKLFWKSTYSVWEGVVELWRQHELALAAAILFFSIVFPFAKLLGLTVIWYWKLPEESRNRLLNWLGMLGKWSMLDVFVVAILIVLVKLGPFVNVEPRVGVYVFAAAILSSMLTTVYIEALAKRSRRHR